MITFHLIFSGCLISFIVVGCIWVACLEQGEWNDGACSCGKGFWVSFDVASDGSRGFNCSEPNCGHTTWQSWRKRYPKS